MTPQIKTELERAKGSASNAYGINLVASLRLRFKLAEFAIEHGLPNESDAASVVLARYFEMVETDLGATWLAKR